MFRKIQIITIAVAIILLFAPKTTVAAASQGMIDQSFLDQGYITVKHGNAGIVRITKGDVKYDYKLAEGAKYPLQLGNGDYDIMVAETVGGTKYKVVAKERIALSMKDQKKVFLQSSPLVDWNDTTLAVAKAEGLGLKGKSEKEKIAAIYNYITKKFKYDYDKAKTVKAGYIPNLDDVFKAGKGICYDYAATFAAMARSEGIPTKLVMGYQADSPDTYHAWNQVYLKDLNKWVTIDTTNDAVRVQAGKTPEMFKDAADFKMTKFY